jgi:hypothetical protein
MERNPFSGTWRLLSYEVRSTAGETRYPWGRDPVGFLIYSDDGYVSVAMMCANRPRFGAKDIKKGTAEEKVAAVDTYISYCGRYEVQGDMVIHHVEVCLFPNWVGNDQKRTYEFDGNRLQLSTEPIVAGEKQLTGHLIWERV